MQIMQDRFVKFMLVVVAGLLAANLFKSDNTASVVPMPSLINSAQAQNAVQSPTPAPRNAYQVKTLNGFPVQDMKDIVALGDGKSFIASNPKGFMVYQVLPAR